MDGHDIMHNDAFSVRPDAAKADAPSSKPPKPPRCEVAAENIPLELRERPQWVGWRYEWTGSDWTKVPKCVRGRNASPSDPGTWATFDDALAAYQQHADWAGIGYVFSADDPYAGIDLDDCIDTSGRISDEAMAIINACGSYAEVSPSGAGVKIFVRGRKTTSDSKGGPFPGIKQIELYDRGRYFTLTGRRVDGVPIECRDAQAELDRLGEKIRALKGRWGKPKAASDWKTTTRPPAGRSDDASVRLRASKYLGSMPPAVSGQNGHGQTYAAAVALVHGFCLSEEEALDLLMREYNPRCQPEWSEKELRHKVSDAATKQHDKLYGWLRDSAGREPIDIEAVWPRDPAFVSTQMGGTTGPSSAIALARADRGGMSAVASPETRSPDTSPQVIRLDDTDLDNSVRFLRQHGRDFRYCHPTGKWLRWCGTHWAEDRLGVVFTSAGEVARSILGEARACTSTGQAKRVVSWAFKSRSRGRLESMVALARSQPGIPVLPEHLDQDRCLFNVRNGTIDLRAGELRAHCREDLITKVAPVEYDPQARCPRFDQFLDEIFARDQALIEYVLRLLGMCLTGDIAEQVLPIFHGSGANGKSVLVDTMLGLWGDYGSLAPPSLLTSGRNEHPTEIADLLGRRFVVASETEQNATLRLQLVKRLTGDDRLKGRFMRQDYFEFARTHKIIMVTNNKPRIDEDGEAAWRRIRLVPFSVTIPADRRDPKLVSTLAREYPGILAKLVEACRRWQESGLPTPPAVESATGQYRESEDHIGGFVDACLVIEPRETGFKAQWFTPWQSIRAAYQSYCRLESLEPVSDRALQDALSARGLETDTQRHNGKSAKGRTGVRLVSDVDDDLPI